MASLKPIWLSLGALAPALERASELRLAVAVDGVLAPADDDAGHAVAPERTRRVLATLARRPEVRLAVLSARSLDDVEYQIGTPRAYVVAASGLLTCSEDGSRHRLAEDPPPAALRQELQRWCERFPGARFADIGPAWTLYDGGIPARERPAFGAGLRRRLRAHAGIRSLHRRHAFDVLPTSDWDRIRTLGGWLDREGGTGAALVFIGADTDDEATHEQVRARGGWTIAVGRMASRAEFGLASPLEVTWFLEWLERELAIRGRADQAEADATLAGGSFMR